jgi:DNA replication protein DnaC
VTVGPRERGACASSRAPSAARQTDHPARADRLLKRLKAARLDDGRDTEMRKLLRTDLLILDDFCLQPMDAAETAAIYEIVVERHRVTATITTSNPLSGWP